MSKSKVAAISNALDGRAYVAQSPLHAYHTAQAVKAALRRRDPFKRLSGVRQALVQYRVSAWSTENGIELRDGALVLLLLS